MSRVTRGWLLGFTAGLWALVGCNAPGVQHRAWKPIFSAKATANYQDEERHRDRYRTQRDGVSLRWLLSHRIAQGMTRDEVAHVLGDDGERVYNDAAIKKGSDFRADDVLYRWGPDNKGNSYYLVFREEHLVNYDPQEYEQDINQHREPEA